ncbi:predicted protein [Plenodomus lingam JN3]|uniref:Predicted protein n=1 Tax=Leptosphaeria maculans (strain JN3 / isolate v23.1.3 / race Av1-4-5-6-7-8) TaxID=985895 RepID=E4ZNL2_LEPMJ|nr:predicted protein [Plenodomus lingam JN3]CBX93071.1 predicted protein [Plenodomus lingam JN3]
MSSLNPIDPHPDVRHFYMMRMSLHRMSSQCRPSTIIRSRALTVQPSQQAQCHPVSVFMAVRILSSRPMYLPPFLRLANATPSQKEIIKAKFYGGIQPFKRHAFERFKGVSITI